MSTMRTGVAAAVASVVGFVNRPYFPTYLFQNGEQGGWWDPSDFSTLFQDSAGTTPVTAVEQPVGLMLDKRLGLTLGSELVVNGDFSNGTTGWSAYGLSLPTLSASSGGLLITNTGVNAGRGAFATITTVIGTWYQITGTLVSTTGTVAARLSVGTTAGSVVNGNANITAGQTVSFYFFASVTSTVITLRDQGTDATSTLLWDNISVRKLPGNHAYTPTAASTARPTVSARYNLYVGTATLATQNVTTVATNYTLRFEGTGSVTLSGTATGTYSAGTHTITCTAGTLTTTVTGTVTNADIRPANDGVGIPAYQRVNTATDYDSVGFPVYLRADGSNDFLQTNSIDFSGTDKMTLCAGVRKLSDAATGTVMELGTATVNGGIGLFAPLSAAANYEFRSTGTATAQATTSNTFAAPITNVLTALGNISGDSAILRVNGSQAASSTADQGTGNYGNYVLNIFSRNQASLFFNGRFYGGVVRGAQSNDQQIAALEGYMNSKTKAY